MKNIPFGLLTEKRARVFAEFATWAMVFEAGVVRLKMNDWETKLSSCLSRVGMNKKSCDRSCLRFGRWGFLSSRLLTVKKLAFELYCIILYCIILCIYFYY